MDSSWSRRWRGRGGAARASLAAATTVLLCSTTACATATVHGATAPSIVEQPAPSSVDASAAPTPSSAETSVAPMPPDVSETLDASAVLPTAAELGSGWGPASDQDHAAEGSLVYLYALTHCVPVSSLATGSGDLDGPAFDPGFTALAKRLHWVDLSNNPDLSRVGQFQEQDVMAYAGPASTFSEVTAALHDCATSPLPIRKVDVQPVAPPTVPAGVDVAAFSYQLGEMLAQIVVLRGGGVCVVADVQDAASTAGQRADPGAEAALVRTTTRAVASAMTS